MTIDTGPIAATIIESRRSGDRPAIPDVRLTCEEGYQVQERVFAARGLPIVAWKIGLTGQAIRDALGSDEPAAGRLAQDDVIRAPANVAIGAHELFAEAELIFEIGTDLMPVSAPFTPADVAMAVRALHAGVELVGTRFRTDDLPLGMLIADNCMADRLVIGDRLAGGWDDQFADTPVIIDGSRDGRIEGSTRAVMGDPLTALTWLANWLAGRGDGLRVGQFVSSGTCTGATPVAPGDHLVVDFPGLGGVTIDFVR